MQFADFCRANGLIVDRIIEGRWVRVPTVDHPRKRNGAYRFMGSVGWVQNHATDTEVSTWRPEGHDDVRVDQKLIDAAADYERRQRAGWDAAAKTAADMLASCKTGEAAYLAYKGLADVPGLLLDDGALFVPMRHHATNRLQGAQIVRWLPAEMRHEKKMLRGMRAKGAVFRIGNPKARRTWLVEGYATGLSLHAALTLLRLSAPAPRGGRLRDRAAGAAGGQRCRDEGPAGAPRDQRPQGPARQAGGVGHGEREKHAQQGRFKPCGRRLCGVALGRSR